MMRQDALRVLFVAYPLLSVGEDSCGGAEQVLLALERELAARGHQTTVAAAEGSRTNGELFATGAPASQADQYQERAAEHNRRILQLLASREFDIIHDHSGEFWRHAGQLDLPILATLHLPRDFYPAGLFESVPQNVAFNCVSQAQRKAFADVPNLMQTVVNGVPVERFPPRWTKQDYLLWLGRICEEKGTHVAAAVAERAGVPLVIAGQVYPFSYHQQYFDRQVQPHLRPPQLRYFDAPSFEDKRKLLQRARGLLLTSQAEETSSLVAMEAAASGTPVIAFRRGALPEIVQDGVTGLLVDSEADMVAAIARLNHIDPRACHTYAKQHFSAALMAQAYEELYREAMSGCERGKRQVA